MKALNLAGKVFGKLTAINPTHVNEKRAWQCTCDCGNSIIVPTFQLTSGNNTSCGCGKSKVKKGDVFGELTVIEVLYKRENKVDSKLMANCLCSCGTEKLVYTRNLTRGASNNCGCLTRKIQGLNSRKNFGEALLNRLIGTYKNNAKNRKLVFELNAKQLYNLFKGNCYYCGIPPSKLTTSSKHYGFIIWNGIDRLNSRVGYTSNNCVSCCETCNFLKSDYSEEEFMSIINKIYNNRMEYQEELNT